MPLPIAALLAKNLQSPGVELLLRHDQSTATKVATASLAYCALVTRLDPGDLSGREALTRSYLDTVREYQLSQPAVFAQFVQAVGLVLSEDISMRKPASVA
jgi:hypothetical protein